MCSDILNKDSLPPNNSNSTLGVILDSTPSIVRNTIVLISDSNQTQTTQTTQTTQLTQSTQATQVTQATQSIQTISTDQTGQEPQTTQQFQNSSIPQQSSLPQVSAPTKVIIEISSNSTQPLTINQSPSTTCQIEINQQTEQIQNLSEEPNSNERSEKSKENEDEGDDDDDDDDDNDEKEESSKKRKRKSHPKDPRFNYGPWSQEEEERFLKALELFGRSWKQVKYSFRHFQSFTITTKISHTLCIFLFFVTF
jgi:hypothetical protein